LVRFFERKFSALRNAVKKIVQGGAPLPLTKAQHLDPNTGPKRILALDCGGIGGILTLQFLQAIESLVKARFGDKTLLCGRTRRRSRQRQARADAQNGRPFEYG
jgi:hypothetical protein